MLYRNSRPPHLCLQPFSSSWFSLTPRRRRRLSISLCYNRVYELVFLSRNRYFRSRFQPPSPPPPPALHRLHSTTTTTAVSPSTGRVGVTSVPISPQSAIATSFSIASGKFSTFLYLSADRFLVVQRLHLMLLCRFLLELLVVRFSSSNCFLNMLEHADFLLLCCYQIVVQRKCLIAYQIVLKLLITLLIPVSQLYSRIFPSLQSVNRF